MKRVLHSVLGKQKVVTKTLKDSFNSGPIFWLSLISSSSSRTGTHDMFTNKLAPAKVNIFSIYGPVAGKSNSNLNTPKKMKILGQQDLRTMQYAASHRESYFPSIKFLRLKRRVTGQRITQLQTIRKVLAPRFPHNCDKRKAFEQVSQKCASPSLVSNVVVPLRQYRAKPCLAQVQRPLMLLFK